MYGNHEVVRQAIADSGVPRAQLFITTKVGFYPSSMQLADDLREAFPVADDGLLPPPHPLPDSQDPVRGGGLNVKGQEIAALEHSLKELGTDYADLCLIHTPFTSPLEMYAAWIPSWYDRGTARLPEWSRTVLAGSLRALVRHPSPESAAKGKAERLQSWANLEAAKKQGLCRHIGVSNYPVELMEELEVHRTEPIFNQQQELHPQAQFSRLQSYARSQDIRLTGYGTGMLLDNPAVKQIAHRVGRSANQVLLRWATQKGISVIPKTNNISRLTENLEIFKFELSSEDMSDLDKMEEQKLYYWDSAPCVHSDHWSELPTGSKHISEL